MRSSAPLAHEQTTHYLEAGLELFLRGDDIRYNGALVPQLAKDILRERDPAQTDCPAASRDQPLCGWRSV